MKAALAVGKKSLCPVDDDEGLPSLCLPLPLTPLPPVALAVVWVVVVNQKIDVAISNSFYVVFLPNICPHNKFHPYWTKNIEVEIISYWLASVGWSGQ